VAWQPAPRPEWVVAVNSGLIEPITDEAAQPLDRDGLLREALARDGSAGAGLEAFGRDDFLEGLDVALPALEDEAELTILGRWITRRFVLRLLQGRLHMTRYLAADPGVVDEEIHQPLFVAGAPRTGTTILHGVLVQDPALRAPLGWELLWPLPPPVPGDWNEARITLAEAELRMLARVDPVMDAIHEYGARNPKECLSSHSFVFQGEEFTARYNVPSYVDWLQRSDMRPAYDYHKLVLQVLQRRTNTTRWVLKSPVHLTNIETVLEVYPDALIAVTHRDPLTVLGSTTSLVANLRWVHSDAVDFASIGRYHADLYRPGLDRLTTLDAEGWLPAGRVHHGHYADFVREPMKSVQAVYDTFGLDLTPEAAARMQAYLDATPKGRHGEHHYDFADLGLDQAEQRAAFAGYTTHFHVPPEV
jgi:hypothetical protein